MSDKEVRVRITGDVSDLEKKLKSIENTLNSLGKNSSGNNKLINNLIDDFDKLEKRAEDSVDVLDDIYDSARRAGKSSYMAELAADLGDIDKKAEETVDNIKDINKNLNNIDAKPINNITKSMTDMQLEDRVKDMQDFAESVNSIKKVANLDFGGTHNSFDKITKESGGMIDNITSGFTTGVVASNVMAKSLDGIAAEIKDVTSSLKGLDALTSLKDKVQAFDTFSDTLTKTRKNLEELKEVYSDLEKKQADAQDALNKRQKELDDSGFDKQYTWDKEYRKLHKALVDANKELKQYKDLINKAESELSKLTKEENKYADELNSKMNRYDRLSEKINKIIDDENQNVLVQKRLAQVYEQTAKSMKNMYDDVEYDKVSKDLERLSKEARDYVETTSLMNFDTLGDDIKKLTKHINEKIEKTKELTAVNSAMDEQTKSTVYHLEAEAEALKEYADTAGYAFKRIEEKAGTDEEWQIIGNIKALEKSLKPEKIREYNEAIAEYFHTINETNGQISKSFLNEDGSFSVAKFIAILERFGRSEAMLAAEYKNVRNKAAEYLKVGDKESQQIAKTAKERLESIATIKKEAQALKEKSEAEEKDAKAQFESLKTQKQDIDAKLERIKSEIKLAEALKESGEATEETNKKHQAAIELQQELRKISDDLASQMVEADKKAVKAKQDLLEATEKLNKAQKDEARLQEVLNRVDQETKINNAKKKLEEVEASQKSAKAKLEEAQAAEKAAKAARDEYEQKRKLIALKEKGDVNAETDENSSRKFILTTERAIKTQKEYNDAIEKTRKAQQDYEKSTREVADAKERLEKVEQSEIDNKREHVKAVNEQAKTLKKFGQAINDINLDEIRDIDKTLGTKLKDLFPSDLPKTAEEFKDYIKSAFSELNDLDFGNFGGLLKDIGGGLLKNVFAKLPAEAKIAAAAIAAVTVAVNKLYESGKKQFFEGLSNVKQKLQPVISAFRSFGREVVTAFESITGTHIDLSSLMEIGPNFEYQMQRVGAIAGSNDKQLVQLTKTAERLGGTTQFTASQVGEAFEYMAMAGYSTEEMLSSIKGVLNLSIASGTDLAKTSDIVTDYMTAMGMEASNTGEFVDKLAATVTSANTTVELFGTSMKQVGSQAGSLGITMTDISTAIGLAANAGVKGSKAGTALKNVLANMASPTEKQADALKKLGFSADKAGSYLVSTDGVSVNLAATMKKLMTATEGMSKAEKAAVLTTIAGKEAMAGLFAIINQGPEAWDELSATIENSTGKVQFWNECMSIAGKSGKEASDLIENMKTVFAETESEAINLGLSTEDLSHAIAVLGKDGKVSADNIKDLFNVIESMNTATGTALDKWREFDAVSGTNYTKGFDYDSTIAKLTADTQGITQAQKEELKTRLENVESYKEAYEIAKAYQKELNSQGNTNVNLVDTIQRKSLATMDYVDKLKLLRDTYNTLGWKDFEDEMRKLGLEDSIDEIKELAAMSETEFNAYTDNLEKVKGMAEQLAEAMDEVTKGSLLTLAAAIENVAIKAFNKMKPAIKGVADEISNFFDVWHNFGENEFTFDGLEKALDALANGGVFKNNDGTEVIIQGLRKQQGKIQQAVVDIFNGLNRFINKGSLKSILDMGTSVVNGICMGIERAKANKSLDSAIDGFITNISDWIVKNGPQIQKAGETIIDSITEGIKRNEGAIDEAMDTICDIMSSWIDSSGKLKATTGRFAEQFVELALENMLTKAKNWIGEKFSAFADIFSIDNLMGTGVMGGIPGTVLENILEGIFGRDPLTRALRWLKEKFSNFNPLKIIKDLLFPVAYADSGGSSEQIEPEQLIKIPSLDDIKSYIKSKIGNFDVKGFIKGLFMGGATLIGGPAAGAAIKVADLINIPTLGEIKEYITSKFSGFNIKEFIKTLLMGGATSMGGAGGAVGGALLKAADLFGEWNPIEDIKGWLDEKIGDWGITKWFKEKFGNKDGKGEKINVGELLELDPTKLTEIENSLNSLSTTASTVSTNVVTAFNNITNNARTQFTGLTNIARNQFVNVANIIRNQMVNCANIVRNQAVSMANIVRNQAVNMANIFRNQFTSMSNVARNQMVNVSNIIRNQSVSWSNIIRNQITNSRNTFTSQMISMASVARTQMTNVSNIVRNQATSWSNVVRNQSANMKAAFSSAFSGLAAVAARGMAACLSTVRSYMSQIRAATAQTMTMNFRVNKTMTTTNVTKNVTQGLANTMGNIARSSASLIAPQAVAIGGSIGSNRTVAGLGSVESLQLSVPLTVDGKEIARATASYNQAELAKLSKRNNRRRGE